MRPAPDPAAAEVFVRLQLMRAADHQRVEAEDFENFLYFLPEYGTGLRCIFCATPDSNRPTGTYLCV